MVIKNIKKNTKTKLKKKNLIFFPNAETKTPKSFKSTKKPVKTPCKKSKIKFFE
jgi:hypothetical protein